MTDTTRAPLALLTGANGGIGRAYCRQMLGLGYDLIVTGRSADSVEALAAELGREFPERQISPLALDISDLDAVSRFGQELARRFESLDVLLHCAGVFFFDDEYRRGRSGTELNYATHVLGPYALTIATRDLLCAAAHARVVLVSSTEHRRAHGGAKALVPAATVGFSNMDAYRETKWATMLLATGLQGLFTGAESVDVLTAHPGLSITGIQHKGNPSRVQRAMIWLLGKLVAGSPEGGARPLVQASTQGHRGEFYGPRGFMEARGEPGLVSPHPDTLDTALAANLITQLETIAAR